MLYVARMFTCGFHSQYLDAAALTCPTDSWKKKKKGLMLMMKKMSNCFPLRNAYLF